MAPTAPTLARTHLHTYTLLHSGTTKSPGARLREPGIHCVSPCTQPHPRSPILEASDDQQCSSDNERSDCWSLDVDPERIAKRL
jgi:hypothetical protein